MAIDTAILILNHFQDRHLMKLCREILNDYGSSSDVFLLTDKTQSGFSLARPPSGCRQFTFKINDLAALGYPRCDDIFHPGGGKRNYKLGYGDLPVLLHYRKHKQYRYYWLIEYDVRFSGNWRAFFSAFEENRADLLGTSLLRRELCPQWDHWGTLRWPEGESVPQRPIRGFFPVFRLSNRALATLDKEYSRGFFDGHMEALMPTVLHECGLRIEDIGGQGEFVRPENANRFYWNDPTTDRLSPGTFVYRPVMRVAGSDPDHLWHPVKPQPIYPIRRLGRAYERGKGIIGRLFTNTRRPRA